MWAYFVKDVKENARWALLATLALAVGAAYLLYRGPRQTNSPDGHYTLVGDTYLTGTQIAFAAAGLAVGLTLALGDARRGHWGFAVHRPLPRGRLFAAKFLAGAALYGLATSVAVGVAAVLANTPQVVQAPFAAPMLLPTLYFQLAGVMWLAAGLSTGLRQARWAGGRLLPAVFAAAVAVFVGAGAITFTEAALCVGAATAVLTIAAGVAFTHNGDDAAASPRARTATAVVLGTATTGVLAAAALVGGGVWGVARGASEYAYPDYLLDSRGRPYRVVHHRGGSQFFDLQGHPLSPADRAWLEKDRPNIGRFENTDPLDPARSREERRYADGFLQPSHYLQAVSRDDAGDLWFYVVSRGTVEARGVYGVESGAPHGSLGPSGYRPAGEPPEPFLPGARMTSTNTVSAAATLVNAGSGVYLLDFVARTSRRVFDAPAGDRVFGSTLVAAYQPLQQTASRLADVGRPVTLAAVTRGTLHLVPVDVAPVDTPTGDTKAADAGAADAGAAGVVPSGGTATAGRTAVIATGLPIDTNVRAYWNLLMTADDGVAALSLPGSRVAGSAARLVSVYGGRETGRLSLPALPPLTYPPDPTLLPLVAVNPPVLGVRAGYWAGDDDESGRVVPPPGFRGVALAAGGVSALATLWLARRRGLGRRSTVAWAVLAALLGVVAPLTLAGLTRRVVRVPCPACGRPRPVDREHCPHCDAAFPDPADAATAVFEAPARPAA